MDSISGPYGQDEVAPDLDYLWHLAGHLYMDTDMGHDRSGGGQ